LKERKVVKPSCVDPNIEKETLASRKNVVEELCRIKGLGDWVKEIHKRG
jgi:3-methyladenine DNA glycosylase/8-oxoguanine DNA glycosylase